MPTASSRLIMCSKADPRRHFYRLCTLTRILLFNSICVTCLLLIGKKTAVRQSYEIRVKSQLPCEMTLWTRTFVSFALDKRDKNIGSQRSKERKILEPKRKRLNLQKKGKRNPKERWKIVL